MSARPPQHRGHLTFALVVPFGVGLVGSMLVLSVVGVGMLVPKEVLVGAAGLAGTGIAGVLVGSFGRGLIERLRGVTGNAGTSNAADATRSA